jgi:hypothetical protein
MSKIYLTCIDRFLKKNGDTGEWEEVGDDIAREKGGSVLAISFCVLSFLNHETSLICTASQVLRDAVAGLLGGTSLCSDSGDTEDTNLIER